jgi:hypothetical protein
MTSDGDIMERHLIEKRPSWWLLYAIAAVMVALVALIETSVPSDGPRVTLETAVVVTIFALMLRWVRANRGRIELAEAAETRKSQVETVLANGQPALAHGRGPRVAWARPRRGGRQRA